MRVSIGVIIILFLAAISAIASFLLLRQRQQIVSTPQELSINQKLTEWNNFKNLPTIRDCLLTTENSCFPFSSVVTLASPDFEIGRVASLSGGLNRSPIRALLLADPDYKGNLAHLDDINGKGFMVDVLLDDGYQNNINPLVISEIIKIILMKKFPPIITTGQAVPPDFLYGFDHIPSLSHQASQQLFRYNSLFNSPLSEILQNNEFFSMRQPIQLLADNHTLTSLQKAIIIYFFENFSKKEYAAFLDSFNNKFQKNIQINE